MEGGKKKKKNLNKGNEGIRSELFTYFTFLFQNRGSFLFGDISVTRQVQSRDPLSPPWLGTYLLEDLFIRKIHLADL